MALDAHEMLIERHDASSAGIYIVAEGVLSVFLADSKDSESLYVAVQVALDAHEMLFGTGDASDAGIYIVVEGALGVFLAGADGAARHTNTLHPGESIGDLDVLDGAQS